MKYTLYLDSSYYLTMGLFNEEGPLFFQTWTAPRASGAIHKELDQLLKNYSLDFSAIEKVVYAAGPGLYTGMRIASGLAQCFELLKIPVLSFYHFQVPFLLEAYRL